jgi:solute carrier family 41
MLLLYIAHVITHLMWKWKIDPDNATIPYLTSLGDLIGSSLLAVAFLFLQTIGHPYGENAQEIIGPTAVDAGYSTTESFAGSL